MTSSGFTIKCDECGHEFPLKSAGIQETRVEGVQEALTLVYFTCASCGKVYACSLRDDRWHELRQDLDEAKRRVKRNWTRVSEDQLVNLQKIANKKLQKIKAHEDAMQRKYPGGFTVVRRGATEHVKYEPRRDSAD